MGKIELNSVGYTYKVRHKVLQNINISIEKGKISVLLGPNGSGKTTMMKLIFDLLDLQEGSIKIDGMEHTETICKMKMIYLPGDTNLPEFLTGREYVNLLCNFYKFVGDTEILYRLIGYYSMEKVMDQLIETYSHGMKKKIQLIVAFYIQPEIIVIDETLNGIDLEAKEVTKELVRKISKKKTILLCTHELEIASEIGERIILMYKGTIYQDTSITELLRYKTLSEYVKDMINFEEANYEI